MKFKFKTDEKTTLDDVQDELDTLKSANVKEMPLNHLRKIIDHIGGASVPATGSVVRFTHPLLKGFPHYQGYFSVHKIHKGGDKDEIRMVDYKKYLYPALSTIIATQKKLNNVK